MTHPLLAALGLPARWRGRDRFVVLLDAFGRGEAVAALAAAWSADPARCEHLDVIALAEVAPAAGHDVPGLPADWPPGTPDFHAAWLDGTGIRLLLAGGDPRRAWRDLVARVDAFHLAHPVADPLGLPKALVRLAADDATVAADHPTEPLRASLRARGFVAEDGAAWLARYRPPFRPSRAPVRRAEPAATTRHALVIGAGLAGAATALGLARQGWRSTVLDRHTTPAADASGNPAGLFHGIVHPDDGTHARFNRAAAVAAQQAVRDAIERHGVPGAVDGLLRLASGDTPIAAMSAQLARHGLGPDYARALDAAAASAVAHVPVDRPAWFYPGGGWVAPGALVRAMFASAGPACTFVGDTAVARIARDGDLWCVFDGTGREIARSAVLVIAAAQATGTLLDDPAWPVDAVRGQITQAPCPPGLRLPAVPIAGGGYVMPEVAGHAVFGATAQAGDPDPQVRDTDHRHNLAQLARLLPAAPALDPASLSGRVAWRWVVADRLPLLGAVPAADAGAHDQLRFVPRQPGLFVFAGLGSRGITWSALGGDLLAAMIAGAPSPVPAALLDAVDPGRFAARTVRRAAASGAPPA